MAVTVIVPGVPAVRGVVRPDTARVAAAAGLTTIGYWPPVMVLVTVSRARTESLPAVLRVTLKVCVPALAAVKV